jgi:hypothetical protein
MKEEEEGRPDIERRRRRTLRILGLVALAGVVFLVGFGAWGHARRRGETLDYLARER